MPPDRGRASKACTSCRKQKTRCYESGQSGAACLRCERLKQRCSFIPDGLTNDISLPESDTAVRLERLENTVSRLVERLGANPPPLMPEIHLEAATENHWTSEELGDRTQPDSADAPVLVIRDMAADSGIEVPNHPQTVSLEALVPISLAADLIYIFSENYGRWVLFDPDIDGENLLSQVQNSPLLFCACCLIAVRHTSQEIAASIAPKLYETVRSLVQNALLLSPQPVEFFQAILVLCMWSTTVGQVPLSIDSWLLSGFALQHSQSSDLFSAVMNPVSSTPKLGKDTINCWLLWNHLCLVHLHYCVGTSRRSMLQDWHIARCRAIVGSDRATNYELRMVGEIHLYYAVYKRLAEPIDIDNSLAALQSWKREWRFVLEQPRAQFLMMGFHFSNILIYDRSLKSNVHGHEPVVVEMINHSRALLNLAMDTVDERTRHLSDHIYHMITYAAITICRLQDRAAPPADQGLNLLISNLIQWLQSVGLPCHAAHLFGTIIENVHRKLRHDMNAPTSPAPADEILTEEFTKRYFPEFLGVEATANGSWDLMPDFAFEYPGMN